MSPFSVGDPSPFTSAEFILGEGSKQAFLDPGFCHSPIAFSSIRPPEDRLRFLTASDLNVTIGPYPHAMDIFGDGSMYIVDASGTSLLHAQDWKKVTQACLLQGTLMGISTSLRALPKTALGSC